MVLPATWSASLRPVVLPKGGHAGSLVLWKLRWLSAISSLNSALHLVLALLASRFALLKRLHLVLRLFYYSGCTWCRSLSAAGV